jgi:hypothetical protein
MIWWAMGLLFGAFVLTRRRAWEALVLGCAWRESAEETRGSRETRTDGLRSEARAREDEISLLETRVSELEARLDFTERLLETRRRDRAGPSA